MKNMRYFAKDSIIISKIFSLIILLCIKTITLYSIEISNAGIINDRDGLSQNSVLHMMQDSRGFMWVCTINGLNRYDGRKFVKVEPDDPSFNGRINNVREDSNGYLWMYTNKNTTMCYDLKLEKFVDNISGKISMDYLRKRFASNGDVWLWNRNSCCRIHHSGTGLQTWKLDSLLNKQPVTFFYEDSKQNIWVGAGDKIYIVKGDSISTMTTNTRYSYMHEINGTFFFMARNYIEVWDNDKKTLSAKIQVPDKRLIISSHLLKSGDILTITKKGVYIFDSEDLTFHPIEAFSQKDQISNAKFITDNRGNLWIYNSSGILWKQRADNTFEPLRVIPDILSSTASSRYSIYHDSRDIIWITTYGNGLFAIDEKEGKTYHYTSEKELPTDYLLSVTEDKSGEIWLGTEFAGIVKLSLINYPVKVFLPAPDDKKSRGNAIRLIYEDAAGGYWLGTRGGTLYMCDSLFNILDTQQLKNGLPYAMAEDTLGCKWIATKGNGLFIYPPDGNKNPENFNLPIQNAYSILRDTKNRMWIASFGTGLYLAERNEGKLSFRQFDMNNSHRNSMRTMIQDRQGIIWIGSSDGIIAFDPNRIIEDESEKIYFRTDNKNPHAVNNSEVKAILEDSKGRIWFGTTGGGLNLLMRKEELKDSGFKHFTSQNGLSNEIIQAIQEDDQGNIWVSTENGISKLDPETERFENFLFSTSRQPIHFDEQSYWKKKDGQLLFGSYNGMYIFDPQKIGYSTYSPQTMLTNLWVNGSLVHPSAENSPLTESISETKKIVLKHDQNSFDIEYAIFNYHAPDFNQYIYYLEGYEKDWNPISRHNSASYRNISPGTYFFRVKGCNSFGVWNDDETTLKVIILVPWWESWWAISLYTIIVLAIIFFSLRLMLKMNRLSLAVEMEKQLTEYKLRFFTNISHEFRTPLTIIRSSVEYMADNKDLPPSVKKQINTLAKSSNRLLRLVDQLLEFRRLQNNKSELNPESTEAVAFFNDIFLTFKEMAEKKCIDIEFYSDREKYYMLLDRSKMDKVIYNLLSNALKNTPDGGHIVLSLIFLTDKDNLILSVSDNGPGIPKDQLDQLFVRFKQFDKTSGGTGIGLHLTAELVNRHKGKITYTASRLGGACFSVSIPLKEEAYSDETSQYHQHIPTERLSETVTVNEDVAKTIQAVETSVEKSLDEYKIMVIEDNEEVREFVRDKLSDYFSVSVAENGKQGLEKISEVQPDIVICDVMMPEMDGFEVTKYLKSNFETSHIPIIILTAYTSDQHQLEGIQSGADAYITKPFSMQYLLVRTIKLIEQREKLQRRFVTEPGLKLPSVSYTDRDKEFIDEFHNLVVTNIGNSEFVIDDFTTALCMSRTLFFQKVRGLTGKSPNEYLRVIRMKKAASLLTETNLSMKEIAFLVGISDSLYFSRCFKEQFKLSPTQYREKHKR